MICAGCKRVVNGFGGLGRHVRSDPSCTPEMRFWGKVKKTDTCWLWMGAVNTTGYGMANLPRQKNIVAHRLAYTMLKGPIPDSLRALHKCDTPRCVNPDHIFLGTQKDNGLDCKAKGRTVAGRKRNATNEQAVREMRRLKAEGARTVDLAKQFGISPNSVSSILTRKAWRNVE